jgi:hypothetical protein
VGERYGDFLHRFDLLVVPERRHDLVQDVVLHADLKCEWACVGSRHDDECNHEHVCPRMLGAPQVLDHLPV